MTLNQIGQIALHADDLSRAVAFYRDTLGMRFLFQAPPGLAFFDCGGIRLMLDAVKEKDTSDAISSLIYYKVDDIEQTFEALSQQNVEFISPPRLVAPMPDHDLWMAFFRDPDQNSLALMSEVPRITGASP